MKCLSSSSQTCITYSRIKYKYKYKYKYLRLNFKYKYDQNHKSHRLISQMRVSRYLRLVAVSARLAPSHALYRCPELVWATGRLMSPDRGFGTSCLLYCGHLTASANSEDSWKRFCLSRTRLRRLVTLAFRRRIQILLLTYLNDFLNFAMPVWKQPKNQKNACFLDTTKNSLGAEYLVASTSTSTWGASTITVPSTTRALRERQPPSTPKFKPKVTRESNPDFRINPDPDVCRICP